MRPFPKAPPRNRKAKKRHEVKCCVLTENEDAILHLREKEEKKLNKLEAQKAKEEKKAVKGGKGKGKKVGLKGKEPAKKKPRTSAPPPESSTDEEAADDMVLNDSSEYSTEEELEVAEPGHYPFLEKQPEVRDFEFFRIGLDWIIEP